MSTTPRQVIPAFVAQHLEDAASLRDVRSVLLRAPRVTLNDLGRADERLSAHLDGLSIAGAAGVQASQAALAQPGVGNLFVAAVLAIEQRDMPQIDRLVSLLDLVPDAARGLASALGWVSPGSLRGISASLLASSSPAGRWLGISACALHRVEPGQALNLALGQLSHAGLRARAIQTIGELSRSDLLPVCIEHLADDNLPCRFASARSGLLLGERCDTLISLRDAALLQGPFQLEALALFLFSVESGDARALVRQLAAQGAPVRTLIKAAGWAGDPQVIPWLFKHMGEAAHARLAAEAFSFITGADLHSLRLHRAAPPLTEDPNDAADDNEVVADEDDDLPWPDLPKLTAWWQQADSRLPESSCLFAGAAPTVGHCLEVLRHHTQRLRIAAALRMSLAKPCTVLFNCAAPAARQARLLSQM